jgi:hypothetical protein
MATKREHRLRKQAELKEIIPKNKERETFKIDETRYSWKKYLLWGASGAVLLALLILFFYKAGTPPNSGTTGGLVRLGQSVDGIPCGSMEVTTYHVHAHLIITGDGVQRQVPAGIGIANPSVGPGGFVATGTCFMWLHTHDASGVIHIEAPAQQDFTLRQFFDIWGKKLSSSRVGDDSGTVTAFVNGRKYEGDPGDIKLVNHQSIVLMIGKTIAVPGNYNFAASGL